MPSITMTVNDKQVSGDVEGRTRLVQFIRDHLG
jgi:aerobic-type carbon monoxide dehydrogenase small subunit (CoxS/CutS family)